MAQVSSKKPPKAKSTKKPGSSSSRSSALPENSASARKLEPPKYKSFRLSKRIRQPKQHLPSGRKIFKKATRLLWNNKRLFLGILLIYCLASLVLVKGLSITNDLKSTKDTLDETVGGGWGHVVTGVTLLTLLAGTINNPATEVGGAYQSLLFVIVSLVTIWALRKSLANKSKIKIQAREAYYQGLYPMIPFVIVIVVIGLQLIPVMLANFLYSIVISGGLAVTVLEKALWIMLFLLLVLLSCYMITSSLFALYIVTLPDVRPMQALRSARELVRYRRPLVMRRLLFLPVALLFLSIIIMLPFVFLSPSFAEWLFFFVSMGWVVVAHSYLYMLYKELL